MPPQVVQRANALMHHLEQDKSRHQHHEKIQNIPANNYQLALFEADPAFVKMRSLLNDLDVNATSPMEALLKLSELKSVMNKSKPFVDSEDL